VGISGSNYHPVGTTKWFAAMGYEFKPLGYELKPKEFEIDILIFG